MKKKLLLADDSVTIQKVVQITFSQDDYELTVVDNGDIAFEKARSQRPDLILADVFMPGKNGYELCAAVKNDPSLATVPVLLLTGTFEPFDEAKAKSAGADRWIAKPFESQALIACVEELLKQAGQAPAITQSIPQPAPASAPAPASVETVAFAAPPDLAMDLSEDIWGSDFAAESDISSSEQPVADAFAATSQDDLWDVSGFETETPVDSAAGAIGSDDLWGESFETPPSVSESVTSQTPAVEDDAWGSDDFSTSVVSVADEPAVSDFLSTGMEEIPFVDEVEILDEIDLLEPFAESSPEIALQESFTTDDFSFAEEPLSTEVFEAPSVFVAPVPVEPIVTPLPLPVMNVQPPEVAVPLATGVATNIATLSDAQLELIVERVAGVVVSRLAGTLLEKIAWEVVPDLAETMIKEELRKIRESVAAG